MYKFVEIRYFLEIRDARLHKSEMSRSKFLNLIWKRLAICLNKLSSVLAVIILAFELKELFFFKAV